MDNWVSVDNYGVYLLGYLWQKKRISDDKIKALASSDNMWQRRSALAVSLNQKARGGQGDAKRTLEICQLLITDREDMIIKALSWALRGLAKREPQAVMDFINTNNALLALKVRREVKHKLEKGTKN